MSDLIDLDCSQVTSSLDLVQPLIPPPKNEVPLVGLRSDENRRSVGSNPFDRVLEEIMEYTQKKEDPFEQVLEKALRCNSESKTPKKQKKPSDVLKVNKSLDESVFDCNNESSDCLVQRMNRREGNSLQGTDLRIDGQMDSQIPALQVYSPSPHNSSILNYSVMNDSLFEDTENPEEKLIKSIIAQRVSKCVEKATLEAGNMLRGTLGKEQTHARSLSERSPLSMKRTRAFRQRSRSTLETFKDLHNNDNSMISLKSTNTLDGEMNKAFLKSRSQISIASTFSNISPIRRLNSISMFSSLSSASSICPMNRAYLELGSKEDESNVSLNVFSQTTGDVLGKRALNSGTKCKMEDKKALSDGKNEGKLIDVEDFVRGKDETNGNKSSSTDSSLDSVFTNASMKVDKSILKAAKKLAKTFEELANSTAASNSDELISSVAEWNFEDLPESGDEASTQNLIELPVTPRKFKPETSPALEEKSIEKINIESEDSSSKSKDSLKSLETEFLEPQDSEKKVLTTLFLDLEKVIGSKNNPEAVNLLSNLEKILGVECKNNAELLTLCLDNTNDLSKCSRKSETKLNCSENIMENQIDKSNEDNLNQETPPVDVNVNKEINLDEKSKSISKFEVDETPSAEQEKENLNSSDNAASCLLKDLGKVLQEQVQDPKVLSLFQSLGKILSDVSKGNNLDNYQMNNSETPESSKKDYSRKRLSVEDAKKKPRRKSFSNIGYRHSLDSPNVPKMSEKLLRKSTSASKNNSFNSSFSNDKSKSRLIDMKKRYPSDPSGLHILELNKKKTDSSSLKDNAAKVATNREAKTRMPVESILPNNQKVRTITSAIDSVKNQIKLKKKVDVKAGNKKGPLKAVIPLGNMQRHGSSEKTMTSRIGGVTPPKSGGSRANLTIPSSTPNSVTGSTAKKAKPVASSTPEGTAEKFHRNGQSPPKRYSNFSRRSPCNISPITTYNDNKNSSPRKTPKRNNSMSSPRAKTPSFNRSCSDTEKKSPVSHIPQRQSISNLKPQAGNFVPSHKKVGSQPSPLKNSNSINSKVKSDHLISKIKRRGGEEIAEKENTFA